MLINYTVITYYKINLYYNVNTARSGTYAGACQPTVVVPTGSANLALGGGLV
jgi:hypothetical protein